MVLKKLILMVCLGVFMVISIGAVHKPPAKPVVFVPVMDKKELITKAYQESQVLVKQGVVEFKAGRLDEAMRLWVDATIIFPPNTQAYKLLIKMFLRREQELRVYEALERAGRSYPSFDDILKVVDDQDLARIPLPVESADIYVAPFKDNKKMALSFMFDDGEGSVYTGILPLFEKYGYRASISIVAGSVSSMPGNPYRGSWSEWKDAVSRGFEIVNHSMNHRDSTTLKPEDFKVEVDDSQALIEKNVGKKVSAYVFPFDRYSPGVLEHVIRTHPAARQPDYLRLLYGRAVNIMYGGVKFSVDTANRLVDIGISRRLWLVAECHGLVGGGPDSYKPLTEDFIDRHLSYVRSHSPDVWVDTFGGVFEYLLLRKGTQILRQDISENQVQIILHNASVKEMARPLTVVLKVAHDVDAVVAQTPDGASLKAWPCGMKRVCVNIPDYDRPVRVAWRSQKP